MTSCDLFQVDLLRLRSESGPHMMKVEQIVTQLERADQVIQQTIDGMLCHTPTGKRKQAPIMEERKTSRRTLKPLQSTLLSEWEKLCAVPKPAISKGVWYEAQKTLTPVRVDFATITASTSPQTHTVIPLQTGLLQSLSKLWWKRSQFAQQAL